MNTTDNTLKTLLNDLNRIEHYIRATDDVTPETMSRKAEIESKILTLTHA